MIQVIKNNPFCIAALAVTAIVISTFFIRLKVQNENKPLPNWYGVISSDGAGYYSYLPAMIIYQDLDYNYVKDPTLIKRYKNRQFDGLQTTENGDLFNKYYLGTSILILPFFLLAVVLSWILGFPVDGFSEPFQVMTFIAALTYLLLGLYYITKSLNRLGISKWVGSLIVIALGLGTNLVNYTYYDPSFSHVYVFFLISWFIYVSLEYLASPALKSLGLLGVLLGLIFIARPTSVLCILAVPIVCSSYQELKRAIQYPLQNPIRLLILIFPTVIFICIQLLLFRIQLNGWKFWSYEDEGFNFSNPQIFKFLFGFRKGLFVYSPVFFLSLLGGFWLLLKSRVKGIGFFISFFAITYVLSSWWCWWFGGGFGSRAMIDFYAILAIPMAYFLHQFKFIWARLGLYLLVGFFIYTNLIQSYQYWRNIMPFDHMTKEKFWQIFLETDSVYRFAAFDPEVYKNGDTIIETQSRKCRTLGECNSWNKTPVTHQIVDGDSCVMVDNKSAYGLALRIPAKEVLSPSVKTTFSYCGDFKITDKKTQAVIVSAIVGKGKPWRGIKLNRVVRKTNEWIRGKVEFPAFERYSGEDTLVFFLLNEKAEPVFLKNVEIQFYHHTKSNQ